MTRKTYELSDFTIDGEKIEYEDAELEIPDPIDRILEMVSLEVAAATNVQLHQAIPIDGVIEDAAFVMNWREQRRLCQTCFDPNCTWSIRDRKS